MPEESSNVGDFDGDKVKGCSSMGTCLPRRRFTGCSGASRVAGPATAGWIAAGDRASFRIKVIGGTGSAQIDNFAVQGTLVPEPSAFALITGVLVMATVATRRRNK